MKKAYPYNVLGNKRCVECGKRLKKRIVEEKPTANHCYRCGLGKTMKERNENGVKKHRERTERKKASNG